MKSGKNNKQSGASQQISAQTTQPAAQVEEKVGGYYLVRPLRVSFVGEVVVRLEPGETVLGLLVDPVSRAPHVLAMKGVQNNGTD